MPQPTNASVAEEGEPSVELAKTCFAKLTGVGECSQFTCEALIIDQPLMASLRETAMSSEESQEVAGEILSARRCFHAKKAVLDRR